MKTFICTIIAIFLSQSSAQEDSPFKRNPLFASAKAKYEEDIQKAEGKAYDVPGSDSILAEFKSAVKKCEIPRKMHIEAVLEIDEGGKVNSWTYRFETKYTQCLLENLTNVRALKPPFAPFHLWFSFRMH